MKPFVEVNLLLTVRGSDTYAFLSHSSLQIFIKEWLLYRTKLIRENADVYGNCTYCADPLGRFQWLKIGIKLIAD